MDFSSTQPLLARTVHFLTASRYTAPFWLAVALLLFFTYRRASLSYLWRNMHLIEDLVLEKQFLASIDLPLRLLIVGLAVTPFIDFLPSQIALVLTKAFSFLLPLLLLHLFIKSFDLFVFTFYFEKHRATAFPTVFRVAVLSFIYILFILVLLEYCFGLNVLPLIATSTVATAVLGLALQDTLKNLFAGLTISLEKRFYYGDWVSFRLDSSLTTVGEISEIGWRTTRIKTLDDNYAVIPNVMFTSNHVVNFSRPSPCYARIIEFPLDLHAEPKVVCQLLIDSLKGVDGITTEPAPEALPTVVKTDSVIYRLRFWIKDFVAGDRISGQVITAAMSTLGKSNLLTKTTAAEVTALPVVPPPPPASGHNQTIPGIPGV